MTKSLHVTCPSCGLIYPLEAGLSDGQARQFAALMGRVPPSIATPLLAYIRLFTPAKQGLTWTKALKFMDQMLPDIMTQSIKYNGRAWATTESIWLEGLISMQDKRTSLALPLSNHNYLYRIIAGLADKAEAGIEAQRQQRSRPPLVRCADNRRNELGHLQRLYDAAPSPQLKQQIDALEKRINTANS